MPIFICQILIRLYIMSTMDMAGMARVWLLSPRSFHPGEEMSLTFFRNKGTFSDMYQAGNGDIPDGAAPEIHARGDTVRHEKKRTA